MMSYFHFAFIILVIVKVPFHLRGEIVVVNVTKPGAKSRRCMRRALVEEMKDVSEEF